MRGLSLMVGEGAGDRCRRSHSLSLFDRYATLKNANLTRTNISRANLTNAVVCGATLSGWYVTRNALCCGIALTQSQCLQLNVPSVNLWQ